jgi:chemotaxis protein MotA
MDIMSFLGYFFGILVVLFGILWTDQGIAMANLDNFWDVNSVIITIGGVIVALMISYPLDFFAKIPKHLKIVFFPTKYDPQEYIAQIVEFATEARINGLLSLESKLETTEDPFLKSSMMLVVDAVDPEKVKSLLETELSYLDERHANDRAFYDMGAAFGPAFGMIGTLMGLINLLKQLDDASKVAPAMALALVTTFYGSVLANMIFMPISAKLKTRHDEEYLCKTIVAEGVQSIQAGDNPRFIGEKLNQLLPGYLLQRDRSDDKMP